MIQLDFDSEEAADMALMGSFDFCWVGDVGLLFLGVCCRGIWDEGIWDMGYKISLLYHQLSNNVYQNRQIATPEYPAYFILYVTQPSYNFAKPPFP